MPVAERARATSPATGASPAGARDQQAAARAVREMFSAIAPRYDLLNHVLSCNVDRLWWRRAARTFDHILRRPDARVLDLCCGTCDMTLALEGRATRNHLPLVGADFARPMLTLAARKLEGRPIRLLEADALQLPFADRSFDLVVSAFGFRNLANYRSGLQEILRVLRSGGEMGILDFSEPSGLLGKAYRLYFRHVLPRIGNLISGSTGAYSYLPASVERFPQPPEMLQQMRDCGFKDATWKAYSFGIAGLFRGIKA